MTNTERDLLIEAESELELSGDPGHVSLHLKDDDERGAAEVLTREGYLRIAGPDAVEITSEGQAYILQMVGLR